MRYLLLVAGLCLANVCLAGNIPFVSSLSPNSGPPAGGTSVTIAGGNFTGALAVNFGATSATSFTVDTNSQITAISPAGVGTVDVTVNTPSGTSAINAADQFTYMVTPVTLQDFDVK